MNVPELVGFSKSRLDEVVECLKKALSDDKLRCLSQRAVQAKVWHLQPTVSSLLTDLRKDEEFVRNEIMRIVSKLLYKFHEHALDVTLARSGINQDSRIHAGSSLNSANTSFDLFCLDSKERLYLVLKNYGWLEDFFRRYPLHFYENSFQFVDRVPEKKLNVSVKVFGLGIGGSMAVSGLAKAGIDSVVGIEKRSKTGRRSVGSRYQNASWRAYDIAKRLLDNEAYQVLVKYQQRINVQYDDGSSGILTSDRVQIILGSAIESALASAERYGAELKFDCDTASLSNETDPCDIVALFTGAHTSEIYKGIKEEMGIMSWPELNSVCKMWLRVKPSDKSTAYCTRGGEIGAEQWHYTIESARDTVEDLDRIEYIVSSQYDSVCKKMNESASPDKEEDDSLERLEAQLRQLKSVREAVQANGSTSHFDYIFTNAPSNSHNLAKRAHSGSDGTVVLDGGYTVEVKLSASSAFRSKGLTDQFGAKLVVTGGDACVPPNPLAAYGATLACEAADMLVQLAVGYGHLNVILENMPEFPELVDSEWMEEVQHLKTLLSLHYDARSRSENYFQWVQTLICNLYSLPPFIPSETK